MISPGSTIGIVGGGQLARMSAQAAQSLGYRVVIADPDPNCPAAAVANQVVVARLDKPDEVAALAEVCQVVTYEFENIDPSVLQRLAETVPVYPGVYVLETSQNRVLEKSRLLAMGVPVAPWRAIFNEFEFTQAIDALGTPAVLKTTTEGYDGKGQVVIRTPSEANAAYAKLAGRPLILEGFVAFTCEVSVVVARNEHGQVTTFPVAENIHRNGILAMSIVPARVSESTQINAQKVAVTIANAMQLVGVLGVEMFVLATGEILVNEVAPRPHNSGHFSMDGCVTSQFEQHIRAVCGLPFGSTQLHEPIVMHNIMGEDYPLDVAACLIDDQVKLHLYGKRESRPHRKMGHLNALGNTVPEALQRAEAAYNRLRSSQSIS
jgi:5-(carboxyamino)imidazole ribonucleotide synthase